MNQDNSGWRSVSKRTSLEDSFIENDINSGYKTVSTQRFNQWTDNHNSSYLSDLSNSKLLNNYDVVINKNPLNKTPLQFTPNVPVFDNELQNSHCHLSNQNPKYIRAGIESTLKEILENKLYKIDYQTTSSTPYEFSGRVYSTDATEYMINIFKLKQTDINGNISIVEIRKTCDGDCFGYHRFESTLIQMLEEKKILKKNEEKKNNLFVPFSNDFGSLTLDDCTIDNDNDDNIELDLDNNNDDLNDNTSSITSNDDEFDHNLCETLLQTLYDKDSYREEYIHDAYQFVSYLKLNDKKSQNMIDYIVKKEKSNLVKNIMNPIINNELYCAFIILHVLEAIEYLLSIKEVKSQLVIPNNFKNDIVNLYKIWSNENGVSNKLGPITVHYPRSQQIERRCESILKML